MNSLFRKSDMVLNRDGQMIGVVVTGATRKCQLDGCRGQRVGVRWPDGRMTWPCSEGLTSPEKGVWRIR